MCNKTRFFSVIIVVSLVLVCADTGAQGSADGTGSKLIVPYYSQDSVGWCWAASMSMLLRYYDFQRQPWEIASDFNKARDVGMGGFLDVWAIETYLEQNYNGGNPDAWLAGTSFDPINDIKTVLDWGHPVLVFSQYQVILGQHAIVVTGYEGDTFWLHDPARTGSPWFPSESGIYNQVSSAVLEGAMAPFPVFFHVREPDSLPLGNIFGSVSMFDRTHYPSGFFFEPLPNTSGSGIMKWVWDGAIPHLGYYYEPSDPLYFPESASFYEHAANQADRMSIAPVYANVSEQPLYFRLKAQVVNTDIETVSPVIICASGEPLQDLNPALDIPLAGLAEGQYSLKITLEGNADGGATYNIYDNFTILFEVAACDYIPWVPEHHTFAPDNILFLGQPIEFVVQIGNPLPNGRGAGPQFELAFYASVDSSLQTTYDNYLIGSTLVNGINSGTHTLVEINFGVPGSIPNGTYYVGAVIDPGNTIPERSLGEDNNSWLFGGSLVINIAAIDEYEPDDTYSQANWIYDGSPQAHSIVPTGDVDWVKFSLGSESAVVIETSGASGDTQMWLYDGSLSQLEFNDDGGSGHFSRIDRVCEVDSLLPGTYYVAIDEYGNDDQIADYSLTLTVTSCGSGNHDPQLSNGYVDPPSGDTNMDFYWYVHFYDSDGDPPSIRNVYIDDTAYVMSLYAGSAANGTYRYGPKNLSAGSHNYRFYFSDGNGGSDRLPGSGTYTGPSVSDPGEPVYFPDANLKSAVEAQLGISNPTPTDMLGLTFLDASRSEIADLMGLEYATNLTRLYLDSNQIRIISPVSGLTNLTVLYLYGNQISDISAVSGLTNLTHLHLGTVQTDDISPISGLVNLVGLWLRGSQISDISALSGLTNILNLNLYGNQIDDISVLSTLPNLNWLRLDWNQIRDISALSALRNLTYLRLQGNALNPQAYCTYLPLLQTNNPGIDLTYDSNPYLLIQDCSTNLNELVMFVSHWLETGCDEQNNLCSGADFNRSCNVDQRDFAEFAQYWFMFLRRYEDLTANDIAGMEDEMSSESIDGSDGNDFGQGTFFVYKTSLDRFGKFIVEGLDKSENNQLTIAWVTYDDDGLAYSSGSDMVIRGTFNCDLDEGAEVSAFGPDGDWWWQMVDSSTRSLNPVHGAKFKLMYRAN